MELDWSSQSPHIRSLFHPWQPGDGYDEATIQAAEARLGVRLPAILRNFYLAWGRRRDLTEQGYALLELEEFKIEVEKLIFGVGDQAIWYWGIQVEALGEVDPPVVSDCSWIPSHAHLSSFLDDMIYLSALGGGAIHGGWTKPGLPDLPARQVAWLEENWNKATVTALAINSMAFRCNETWPTLYIRDGQALWWDARCGLAARDAEIVDEIGQRFQITWAERW